MKYNDLLLLYRCFANWHKFLREEIDANRLSVSVFKPNNHYLSHIGFITKKNGPMRVYSARSMERTIGKYSRLIKSTVFSGKNAGNIVERLATRSIVNFSLDITRLLDIIQPNRTSLDDYLELPESSMHNMDHQLWSPFSSANIASDTPIESVPAKVVKKELAKYYTRSASCSLNNTHIDISARALLESHVYGSIMYRRIRHENRRGNHYILFHITNSS